MQFSSFIYQLYLKIYSILPFKKAICVILRGLRIPNDKFYKDTKFNGPFTVKFGSKSFKIIHYYSTIENEIFWKGLGNKWERDTLWLWFELSKSSKVVFDIGANTGIYSLISKMLNPETEVHAFEPSRSVFPKLEKNNSINQFTIHCWKLAMSNFTGFQTFYDSNTNLPTSGSLSSDKYFNDCQNEDEKLEYQVETITMDEFIIKNNISEINLIKIDVEMYEVQVIEGFKKLLQFSPIIFIEILTDEIASKLQHYFPKEEYLYFELDYKKLIPINDLKKGRPYHWNFLLVPKQKSDRISKYIY